MTDGPLLDINAIGGTTLNFQHGLRSNQAWLLPTAHQTMSRVLFSTLRHGPTFLET